MTGEQALIECVVNVSEGRDAAVVSRLRAACRDLLLDTHTDADHNRSVLTLAGPPGDLDGTVRQLASAVVGTVDLGRHEGAHPRIGALDVVPFVSLEGRPVRDGPLAPAVSVRDRFAAWAGTELSLPCFLYGPVGGAARSLPEVRRRAWRGLVPDFGPPRAHPTAGASAVGARPLLVAYNLWLAGADLADGRSVAAALRGPGIRTLALRVGAAVQVSCNLIDPWRVGPGAAFDAVASRVAVERAELVGLVPASVLEAEPPHRWAELGLSASSTIEARLEGAGLEGGRFRTGGL
jgi:glutamate formiminotransferase